MICAIVNIFFQNVFFSNKVYPSACIIVLSYFTNVQRHAGTDISSINSLIFSGDKDFHIIINISLNMVEALEYISLHFQSTNSIFKIYTQKLKLHVIHN